MKKLYEDPEFELLKFRFQDVLNASAEGDPNQVVGDGDPDDDGPIS